MDDAVHVFLFAVCYTNCLHVDGWRHCRVAGWLGGGFGGQ